MFGIELFFGSSAITFLIGIFSITLIYRWSIRNHDYWKKRGVPYVKSVPFFGSLLEYVQKSIHDAEEDRYKKFGKVYGYLILNTPMLSVADPKLLKNIFIKDFHVFPNPRVMFIGDPTVDLMIPFLQDEKWRRVRQIVTPTFTSGKIKKMQGIIHECSRTVVRNFESYVKVGKPVDVRKLFTTFTMDVIASSAFSTKIDSHNNPENAFAQKARKTMDRNLGLEFLLFATIPKVMRFLGFNVIGKDSSEFFKRTVNEIIEERKKTGQVRNDFLQLLIDTAKEKTSEETKSTEKEGKQLPVEDVGQQIYKQATSKNLSVDEMVAQSVLFLLAGFDNMGTTLSITAYYLALHPDIQERLRKEINEELIKSKGELTYESIQSMKYLDNVIFETLRLHSTNPRIERPASADYKLGDTGITIPKGMIISIPISAIHRDPEYFPEPEKFDPERFNPEERAMRDPFTYLPFSSGPRQCLGMRYALLVMKTCIASVVATFNIKPCSKTKVPLVFNKGKVLKQPKDVFLDFELRKDCLIK